MERMKVVLVEPMEKPRIVEIDHDLASMQKAVGGDIAVTYPWEELVGLVHCDDTIALGYPPNRMLKDEDGKVYDIVPGAFFIAGLTEDSFGSLTDALAEHFMERFKYPEMYMRTESGHVVCFKIGSAEPPQMIV